MCKRNIVFLLQQCVDRVHHQDSLLPASPMMSLSFRRPLRSVVSAAILWFMAMQALLFRGASLRAEQFIAVERECRSSLTNDSGVDESTSQHDRFWMVSTRHLTSQARCAELEQPDLAIYRLQCGSRASRVSIDQFLSQASERRSAVIYVHGNRIPSSDAEGRGLSVYRNVRSGQRSGPIDWMIWSWPSDKQGILTHDARIKAAKTDGQGLYLGWLLRRHAEHEINTTLIGYSFGGRIVTGSLHAAAGGSLAGRSLPGEPVVGAPFDAGLVAPAVDSHWLTNGGYHRLATQNLESLVLLYNRRDAVLKRYWLIDRVRGRMALGYSGPTSFAPRHDGTTLPVRSRDCSPSVGLQHDELDYYRKSCRAGSDMAKLIDDFIDAE